MRSRTSPMKCARTPHSSVTGTSTSAATVAVSPCLGRLMAPHSASAVGPPICRSPQALRGCRLTPRKAIGRPPCGCTRTPFACGAVCGLPKLCGGSTPGTQTSCTSNATAGGSQSRTSKTSQSLCRTGRSSSAVQSSRAGNFPRTAPHGFFVGSRRPRENTSAKGNRPVIRSKQLLARLNRSWLEGHFFRFKI